MSFIPVENAKFDFVFQNKKIVISVKLFAEMPSEREEREPEPAEKIVNFYCKCCCVNFPLKSFHLENHVRSYEHIINYLVSVFSLSKKWEWLIMHGV